jgi:GntP family gluconate:H+ symporter
MLQLSDGAAGLAGVMIGKADSPRAPWMSLLVALVIGLPLFFETGLVLLLPIIASAAGGTHRDDDTKPGLMLSALSGLSVVHALVPPHPDAIWLETMDALTGQPLWHFQTGGPILAAPMSYSVNAAQFMAIAAGVIPCMVSRCRPAPMRAPGTDNLTPRGARANDEAYGEHE